MNGERNGSFSRREVLAGALGAMGLAALGGIPAVAAEGKSRAKIGCGTVCFRKLPLEEALTRIRRAGYEYIETQATGAWCPHVDAWKDDPQKFRQLVKKYGFTGVTGLWSPNGAIISDAKSVEGITQAIRWASEAGIPVVHAGDGRNPQTMSEDDALNVLRDRLARILEVAEKNRVFLAIEPHGTFSLTGDGLKKIMSLSPSKWLGINYDTANIHHAGQDEVATLQAIVDRVVHVHVKDIAGSQCVALGEGQVNLAGCLQVLKAHGYKGVFSLETEGEGSADEVQKLIEASRRYLAQALA